MTTVAEEKAESPAAEPWPEISAVTADAAAPRTGSRGTGGTGGQRRTRTTRAEKTKVRITEIQARLSGEMFTAGTLIGFGLPVTGYYIAQESDNFTSAICELASTRPEWVDALERIADLAPGLIIGRTCFGIGAALAVDRNRLDPERQVVKFLGVYQAYLAVTQERPPVKVSESGSRYQPPPASFVPLG